jgi:CubicO group peptidase (beta-lactamase class C family)
MKRLSTSLIAMAIASPAIAQADGGKQKAVDAVFARYAGNGMPGCAVAVEMNGRKLLDRAYGMADLENAIPATPGTIYEAGSVSKQFTAAAIILLARDGKLSLYDDIRKHLPEMPDYGTPVTVGQLIHHTSGLRDWGAVAGMSGWPRNSRVADNNDVLALAAKQKGLNYAPGTHYTYSNTNFNLAAVIVARVSGMSFAQFSETRILRPLGMTNSSWRERYARLVPGRAIAYAREGAGYVIDQPIEDAHGNGGLLTTTADLLRWNAALSASTLGPGFTAAMEKVGVLKSGVAIEYAAGLRVTQRDGRREVAHSGSTGGYRAWLARYPDQRLSVALLCNASDANPVETGRRVADVFLPAAPAAPAARAYVAKELPATGMYLSEVTGLPLRITVKGGKLMADGEAIKPVGQGRWRAGDFTYVWDASNKLTVEAIGERLHYRRADPALPGETRDYAGRYCGVDNDFCLAVGSGAGGTLTVAPSTRLGHPLSFKPAFADAFEDAEGDVLRFTRTGGKVTGLRYLTGRAYGVTFSRMN